MIHNGGHPLCVTSFAVNFVSLLLLIATYLSSSSVDGMCFSLMYGNMVRLSFSTDMGFHSQPGIGLAFARYQKFPKGSSSVWVWESYTQ
jgi:hypothetical protein